MSTPETAIAYEPYTFSPDVPPQMKQNGPISNTDPAKLRGPVIGPATAVPHYWEYNSKSDHYQYLDTASFTRYLIWKLKNIVVHYSVDQTHKSTTVSGYDRSQRTTMEQTLSAVSGGEAFGLSAQVSASLKLDSETVEAWHELTTEEVTQTFLANTTYASWILCDVIEVTWNNKIRYEHGSDDPSDPNWTQKGVDNPGAHLEVIMRQHDDSILDPNCDNAVALNTHISRMEASR